MQSVLPRILVLASSLLFALPPGWCCFITNFTPFSTNRSAASSLPPCCQHKARQKATDSNEAPKPLQHGECPCDERVSTAPDQAPAFTPDLDQATLLCSLDADAHFMNIVGVATECPFDGPPPGSHLHILLCVWRC